MRRRTSEQRLQRMLEEFEEGRARAKDRRQKRNRKIKLKKSYEESKKWLNEVKSKSGCCFCGENDGRVLRFCPRDGEGIKFLPVLVNITRSLRDWKQVIRRCDVICLNCLAKKKVSGKSGRTQKVEMVREVPEIPQESGVNASLSGDLHVSRPNHERSCRCCRRPLARAAQKFCSPRHRLLFWAAKEILKAYCAGQADGLQEIVAELAEVRP